MTLPYIKGLLDAAQIIEDAEQQGLGLASAARSIRRHAEEAARAWACPDCTWVQTAHPDYPWSESDDHAVKVHQTMLCSGNPDSERPCPDPECGLPEHGAS